MVDRKPVWPRVAYRTCHETVNTDFCKLRPGLFRGMLRDDAAVKVIAARCKGVLSTTDGTLFPFFGHLRGDEIDLDELF